MFDGDRECSVCGKEMDTKERNFGLSLKGTTYVFCNSCFINKKDIVRKLLHDEKA